MQNRGNEQPLDKKFSALTGALIVMALGAFLAAFLYVAVINAGGPDSKKLVEIAKEHFAATVGLPFAALAALSLVLILEFRAGKIEFEGFGFKFRGASGPLILWVIAFLAMVAAIKILW